MEELFCKLMVMHNTHYNHYTLRSWAWYKSKEEQEERVATLVGQKVRGGEAFYMLCKCVTYSFDAQS